MRRLPRSSLRILPPALLLLPHSAGLSRLSAGVLILSGVRNRSRCPAAIVLAHYAILPLAGMGSAARFSTGLTCGQRATVSFNARYVGIVGLVPGTGLEPASFRVCRSGFIILLGYASLTALPVELPRHIADRAVGDLHPTGRLRRLAVPCPGHLLKGGV